MARLGRPASPSEVSPVHGRDRLAGGSCQPAVSNQRVATGAPATHDAWTSQKGRGRPEACCPAAGIRLKEGSRRLRHDRTSEAADEYMTSNRVIIAGGGIGGLATALTLHQIGVPCLVFEAVREMRPLGVGV